MKDRASIIALEGDTRRSPRKKDLLIGSLLLYGFPTLETFDPKLLKDTGLTYSDVRLGSEVRTRLELAIDGYDAGDDATREQEDAIEYWEQYGVFSRANAEEILDDQDEFLQKFSILSNSR